MSSRVLIAPSLLACDFGRVAEEIRAVERAGADWLHLDVMDGHFVPNLSFGPVIVETARRLTKLPLDVQLMVDHPDKLLDAYMTAGADRITVHVESAGLETPDAIRAIVRRMKEKNVAAGLSVKPATPAEAMTPYRELIDQVLVMTVEPGFGGQAFLPAMVEKVRAVRGWFDGPIEVDGGINPETAKSVVAAGATVLVAGTSVFKHPDYAQAIRSLRAAEESRS